MSNENQEVGMTRGLAIFLNTLALNAGGRLDPIQVLKTAEKQVESLENNDNHCWPIPANKKRTQSGNSGKRNNGNGRHPHHSREYAQTQT